VLKLRWDGYRSGRDDIGPVHGDCHSRSRFGTREQERTWEMRWQIAQDQLNRLLASRSEPLSPDAVHMAHADLQAFYIQTYHLKDALRAACATTGISEQTVENEINNNPDLALLADLANLDKHYRLSKKTRSGG
jgi:hypothetical protein